MAKIISQTNGTMLFEEINPEKLDLLTMIGDVKAVNSLSDEKIKEILDTLCVSSFDEFIEKFDLKEKLEMFLHPIKTIKHKR